MRVPDPGRLAVAILTASTLAGCSEKIVVYQPDDQPGIRVPQRSDNYLVGMPFAAVGDPVGIRYEVSAGQNEGRVTLIVHAGPSFPSLEGVHVLCETARLVDAKKSHAWLQEPEDPSDSPLQGRTDVRQCDASLALGGSAGISALYLRFKTDGRLGDNFSLVLPTLAGKALNEVRQPVLFSRHALNDPLVVP
jgi:hypothetical protein